MPRKPRIELAGKYHIINRGVAQMHIFKEPADYEQFEELKNKGDRLLLIHLC